MRSNQYYAAIDLGSNSFHMLIVRVVAGSVRIIAKIRRRIRLAEGIQSDGSLTPEVQQRALECMAVFADRVQDIAPENIRAIGTATLRKVRSNDPFLQQLQEALGHPIRIISGDEEAATIYQGVAHTSTHKEHLMVCDIGGASTELALGSGFSIYHATSLDMGCVTWKTRFFTDHTISKTQVDAAIQAAKQLILPYQEAFQAPQGLRVVGSSGTFRALQEIATAQQVGERFTLEWLESLYEQALQFDTLENIRIDGLAEDRVLVFLPGLSILIALFRTLHLQYVEVTNAALREGILYGMLDHMQQDDIQLRTLKSLAQHYHTDIEQSENVLHTYNQLISSFENSTSLPSQAQTLARAVAYLHEIGHSLSYKHAGRHSRYLLKHTNLPGFTYQDRELLLQLLEAVTGIIDDDAFPTTLPISSQLALLCRVLRISIICCQRRHHDAIPNVRLIQLTDGLLVLNLPQGFMQSNAFLMSLLQDECEYQQAFGGLQLQEPPSA